MYSRWGLGIASTSHVANLQSIYAVLSLGLNEGIWNRPTESGNRWQVGGSFAVDGNGFVRWVHVPRNVADVGDYHEAEEVLKGGRVS